MEMSDVKPRIILVFFVRKKRDELDICQIGIFYRSEGLSAEIVTKVFFYPRVKLVKNRLF